jgi:hypothetical protein
MRFATALCLALLAGASQASAASSWSLGGARACSAIVQHAVVAGLQCMLVPAHTFGIACMLK